MKLGKPKYKNFDKSIADKILYIYNKFKGVYGYPTIKLFLEKYFNININKWIVYRYMKIMKIKTYKSKKTYIW